MLLLGRNATVTICHSRTHNLQQIVSTGDIVVAAVGRPELIQGSWIKPGAVSWTPGTWAMSPTMLLLSGHA